MDAAKHDHVVVRFCRGAREFEGIAGQVGNVLHLGTLVVVRQDNGIQVFFEFRYFIAEGVEVSRIGSHK